MYYSKKVALFLLILSSTTAFADPTFFDMTDDDRRAFLAKRAPAVDELLTTALNTLKAAGHVRPEVAKEEALMDALRIVGLFRSTAATNNLLDIIDFLRKSDSGAAGSSRVHGLAGYPAAETLIPIGLPVIVPIRERLGVEEDAKRIALMGYVIYQVLGKEWAVHEVSGWLEREAANKESRKYRNYSTILSYLNDQK